MFYKIKNIANKINEILPKYNYSDVLVVWDIDFTLIMPEKAEAQFPNCIQYHSVFQDLTKNSSLIEIELMYNISGAKCNKNYQKLLIEQDSVNFIKELQEKKIKNIALTAAIPGKISQISKIESWRYKSLKKFDIDFQSSFQFNDLILDKMSSYIDRFPLYHNGLLYSNGEHSSTDKGSVLVHFLNQVAYIPKVVFLIDDREKNLIDLDQAFRQHMPHIHFYPMLYEYGRKVFSKQVTKKEFINYWKDVLTHTEKMKTNIYSI